MAHNPIPAFLKSVRGIGLLLIAFAAIAVVGLYRLEHAAAAYHPATAGEVLIALIVVLAGLPGLAMLSEGASLFREPPPRS